MVSFPKSGHNFIINMHTIFNSKTRTPVHEHDLMIQLNYGIINRLLSSASYRHQNLRLYGIRMCAVLGWGGGDGWGAVGRVKQPFKLKGQCFAISK